MKSKKKIILILLIVIIVALIYMLVMVNNKQEANVNDNYFNYELVSIDWNEIVNIDIDGAEGYSNVVLTYNEIPELDNRVNETINNWESKRIQIDLTSEEAKEEYKLVGKLTSYKEIQWCSLPENWDTLSNGDEFVITCGNDILKKLGYEYEDSITLTVNNLDKVVIETPSTNKASSDVRSNDKYVENLKSLNESINSNDFGTYKVNNDIYDVIGDDVVVYPEDMDDFKLQDDESKRIFIQVYTQTDFQKAKAYALENENIDYIKIGSQVFSKEDNFEEGEEWRGVSMDD